MQKILGYIRKAVQDFDLIQKGDRIAVGVSGGKDSLVLLAGLAQMRRFAEFDYDITAVTIDPVSTVCRITMRRWQGFAKSWTCRSALFIRR